MKQRIGIWDKFKKYSSTQAPGINEIKLIGGFVHLCKVYHILRKVIY